MTKDEIVLRIEEIKREADSINGDAGAHSEADDLYRDFVKFIADGDYELSDLAREVVKVEQVDFERWYE